MARSQSLQTGWSFRIATVAGIPIRVHFTFVLILIYVGVASRGRNDDLLLSLLLLFLLFTCVVLHELGHALMARRFGVQTLEIVLYPVGGVARLKSMPSGKAELLIAVAGPAVNLAIIALLLPVAVGLGLVLGLTQLLDLGGLTVGLAGLVLTLIQMNGMLFLFNLIPAFPMDGGRILRATLALRMPEDRATNIAAGIGQAIALLFAVLGLFTNPMLILIALFVFLGAGHEAAFVQRRFVVRGRTAREAMVTRFDTLAPQDSLRHAAQLLLESHQQDFPVIDAWGRIAGVLSRPSLLQGLARLGPGGAVLDAMDREPGRVGPGTGMDEVLRLLQTDPGKPVLVADGDTVLGIITLENLAEFIEIARSNAKVTAEQA